MSSLRLPPYVLLEIVDWLPFYERVVSHRRKIRLIESVRDSIRKIRPQNDEIWKRIINKCVYYKFVIFIFHLHSFFYIIILSFTKTNNSNLNKNKNTVALNLLTMHCYVVASTKILKKKHANTLFWNKNTLKKIPSRWCMLSSKCNDDISAAQLRSIQRYFIFEFESINRSII